MDAECGRDDSHSPHHEEGTMTGAYYSIQCSGLYWCNRHNLPEKFVANPFMADVHNEIVEEWMCDECYQDAADDI